MLVQVLPPRIEYRFLLLKPIQALVIGDTQHRNDHQHGIQTPEFTIHNHGRFQNPVSLSRCENPKSDEPIDDLAG